ncbi:hypothetical protein TSTA_097950 [Talaromyces stipitatus ATCC 10500]|uniref:Ndc10 domain-containing protein n=1 Tax=Talaromyces stipitatus (strain ATCC 10500 / CBS 375.48 / QM 6759 / NRRL 1006) TaxID=441959 RepID=B8MM27_TALSN|nr:uncharacterized protein TSTA_097950 [Talaromyces stipitatus ATCC 10500]EED13539.1 hypothetical protein TSTA_097950 [Talaromyces stipitatus ATCC 10500]
MQCGVTEIDALSRIAAGLIVRVDYAMDRLLSLLPRTAPLQIQVPNIATTKIEPPRPEDIAIQKALDEVLEYHRVHWPKNTTKNYEPKQKEWKAWCKKMGFKEGGRYLPGDYVDEGKLLLFIKEEVASRPPRRGQRLKAERKRKRTAAVEVLSEGPPSKRKREKISVPSMAFEELPIESDDDEACSELVLMYNTVRSYCSAINKLWAHQTLLGLHNAARPQRFTERGLATIRDGYVASQIPNLTRKIYSQCPYLMKGQKAKAGVLLLDSTAASWTRRLYSEAVIKSSKVTHAGRVSGARLAELNGVSEDQICWGGRWNADQMTDCYLTTLPRSFMRGIADFDPDWSSSYYLPRETVCPPPVLLKQYKAFELDIHMAVTTAMEEDPHSIAIQKAIPAVNDRLSTINDFISGTFTYQFVPRGQIVPPPITGAVFSPTAPIQLPVTALEKTSQAPQYRMSRNTTTIPELWKEWTVGLNGQLSIKRLDELYGSG